MSAPLRQPIVLELQAAGWEVALSKKNHLRATHPRATAPLFLGGTPSDRRAVANVRSQAKRLLTKENP